ncbi:hypothetical protein OG985_44235 [Streptomyces sp. NBC_00289]|uniref:hypothetical protein n=1 Tax=Streptomyces sp. NBC_00289 TaxID=2975703 RepID=UPI00325130F0
MAEERTTGQEYRRQGCEKGTAHQYLATVPGKGLSANPMSVKYSRHGSNNPQLWSPPRPPEMMPFAKSRPLLSMRPRWADGHPDPSIGIGIVDSEVEAHCRPQRRALQEALSTAGVTLGDITLAPGTGSEDRDRVWTVAICLGRLSTWPMS